MDPQQQLIDQFNELIRRKKSGGLIHTLYPAEGEFSRDKYPQHMKFFKLGTTKMARLAQGGNGIGKCVTNQTLIDTPAGKRTAGDLFEAGEPFDVLAWDGEQVVTARASAPFKKPGRHECYRVVTRFGEIEGADHHRILIDGEWRFLSHVYARFRASVQSLPGSSSGAGRSIRGEDGRSSSRTFPGFRGDCPDDPRSHDGRLRGAQGIGPDSSPSPGDALRRIRNWWRGGGPGRRYTSTRTPAGGRRSMPGFSPPKWMRRAGSVCQGASRVFRSLIGTLQPAPPLLVVAGAGPQSWTGSAQSAHQCIGEAFDAPVCLGGNDIISIEPTGVHEVYDFTVETHHNYIAGGLVNHNTLGLGGYETACHLTGDYPEWWEGYRYRKPVRWWVCGKTMRTTRDNQQKVLLGRPNAEKHGGGLVPVDAIDFNSLRRLQGGGGAVDYCRIKHKSGGWSHLGLRFYDQDIDAFFGENLDGAWMDEPAPMEVYEEINARFRGSPNPMLMLTFTPKHGATPLTLLFSDEPDESRATVSIGWDDVPHLDEKWKAQTLANTRPHMRDTVKYGVPAMAEGAVYPVPESKFVIEPLQSIPSHWKRLFGFDGGWHNTACVWIAYDQESDICYMYSEHKAGEMAIPLHAAAIKARGDWIPGIGDAGATNQDDGTNVRRLYREQGVHIRKADKSVDAGIQEVLSRLLTGRLKVYSTCKEFLREYRTYKYKDGKVHKVNDHCQDATRYAIFGGLKYAKNELEAKASSMLPTQSEVSFGRRY